jgi:hypothetical protein
MLNMLTDVEQVVIFRQAAVLLTPVTLFVSNNDVSY